MSFLSDMLSPKFDQKPWWEKSRPVAVLLGIFVFILYLSTMARGLVLGDPTEYTFVANLPAIAHPPGYAFITLTGWLIQHVVPIGDFPWRMHLLAGVSGSVIVMAVYGTILQVIGKNNRWRVQTAALAALLTGTAANIWQHSIHANPHIMTAMFLAVNLFLLTRWAILPGPARWKWLWLFCFSAGLGVTHHPLTAFTFPAYAAFIVWTRPRLLFDWRKLLPMIGFALLGLIPLLYYPIISATQPVFGPHTMMTLEGFMAHVLARGLTESLPYYGWVDQPQRLVVFWSILRLQFAWPLVLFVLAAVLSWMKRPQSRDQRRETRDENNTQHPSPNTHHPSPITHHPSPTTHHPPPNTHHPLAALLLLAFLVNYAFVITLKQQDIMAYILGPLVVIMIIMGVGLAYTLEQLPGRWRGVTLLAVLLIGPGWNFLFNAPRISLQQYDEGDKYVDEVFAYFAGRGESVVLLNNWELMTPLWYTKFVERRWPDPKDVRPEFVSAAEPWLPSVFNYLPGGPVYLHGYRREIVDAGFRLRPRGDFYQVVEPGEKGIPPELTPLINPEEPLNSVAQLLAYELPQSTVQAGDFVPFTLAMRVTEPTSDFYVPVVQVGTIQFEFTTDTHLISPDWQPGEVIVERFDFALPHGLPPGEYPVTVRLRNLSQQVDLTEGLPTEILTVEAADHIPQTAHLLANYRQRVGLQTAVSRNGLEFRTAPWETPLAAAPGEVVITQLHWEVLDYAEESYTIFVHLIDPANQLYVALDYTPLGGAVPTHLWFPKWLPDQRLIDPYRMEIPSDLAPGTYLIEVGLYEMISGRRLHIHDENGSIVGDRTILGAIEVTP